MRMAVPKDMALIMPRPTYPPDYCDREALAYRLSCAPGYVDQLQRMGRIPPPVEIGPGMVRWRWADVERVIEGVANADQPGSHGADPYMPGGSDGKAAPPRLVKQK